MLQGVVECLLDEPKYHVLELCLVQDPTKMKGEGRFGFADVFIPAMTTSIGFRTIAQLLELKYIPLSGLYLKSETGNSSRAVTYKDMETLEKQLSKEDEATILKRKYTYWSKDLGCLQMTTIDSVFKGAVEQLKMYTDTVAMGKAKGNDRGTCDNRINVGDGSDLLQGHVVIGIGRSNFLVHSTELIKTSKEYNRILWS